MDIALGTVCNYILWILIWKWFFKTWLSMVLNFYTTICWLLELVAGSASLFLICLQVHWILNLQLAVSLGFFDDVYIPNHHMPKETRYEPDPTRRCALPLVFLLLSTAPTLTCYEIYLQVWGYMDMGIQWWIFCNRRDRWGPCHSVSALNLFFHVHILLTLNSSNARLSFKWPVLSFLLFQSSKQKGQSHLLPWWLL